MKPMAMVLHWLVTVGALFAALAVSGGEFTFEKTSGIAVQVMNEAEFAAVYGDDARRPADDAAVLALAHKLFFPMPPGVAGIPPVPEEELIPVCREEEIGLLFAALANPAISDDTRRAVDDIIAATIPPLPKTYTKGNFRFFYTDSDANPEHNVTLAQVKDTAKNLDKYWKKYVKSFTTPKHYVEDGKQWIDIKIYRIPADPGYVTYGETGSSWNYISLDSTYCVPSSCKRQTTPSHELFHRVQYAYGYISGTANMSWIVEGTASWSQKLNAAKVGDYMGRMNAGLAHPDVVLIGGRSYDACGLWVYLDEQLGAKALPDIWKAYSTNGLNAKAAVETVANAKGRTGFDAIVQDWVAANYLKDFGSPGKFFDYKEDEKTYTSCSETYGPLDEVPRTTGNVNAAAAAVLSAATPSYNTSGTVSAHGADYYTLTIDPLLDGVQVEVDGTGDLAWEFVAIKGGKIKEHVRSTSNAYIWLRNLQGKANKIDQIGIVVGGQTGGGTYTIKVSTPSALLAQIRWSPIGTDVDLHLRPPAGAGSAEWNYSGDCAYYNRTPSWGSAGTADDPALDHDCITSCTDEQIVAAALTEPGTYRVIAHYYSNRGLGKASVQMQVYRLGARVFQGSKSLTNTESTPAAGQVWVAFSFTVAADGNVSMQVEDEVFLPDQTVESAAFDPAKDE